MIIAQDILQLSLIVGNSKIFKLEMIDRIFFLPGPCSIFENNYKFMHFD